MAVSDRHYYDINRLHKIFVASALALLCATVWMFVADHRREWKRHQRDLRDVERRLAQWELEDRMAAVEPEAHDERAKLEQLVAEKTDTYFRKAWLPLGKKWLELPVLDAFNSPLKIENLWTKGLTIDYNFKDATRFDRCTSCHKAVDRVRGAGSREGEFPERHEVTLLLQSPDEPPEVGEAAGVDVDVDAEPLTLRGVYGFSLTEEGLLDGDHVAVRQVDPATQAMPATQATPAARAARAVRIDGVPEAVPPEPGLKVGDVVTRIDGKDVTSIEQVQSVLLDERSWGRTIELTVLRGLPQPLASHPRLDLFVGASSPHRKSVFGCTICHGGQGSATSFHWASHGPDSPEAAARWGREYQWHENPHWAFPMLPHRFIESSCVQCHHDILELAGSEETTRRTPAPKLVRGYRLIVENGCFGCHEINGFDASGQRIGPDLRLRPNAAAETGVATGVATGVESAPPGTLRPVGASLRHVGAKLDERFLLDWITRPAHYQPETRMPRTFGLHEHLNEKQRAKAERFEAVQIRGIVAYLLAKSQPIELADAPRPPDDEAAKRASIDRGRQWFQLRGCLACHKHDDFPKAASTFGSDLSRLGDKLAGGPSPRRWLYDWLRRPAHYSPGTRMPDVQLKTEPDEAADVLEYLLSRTTGWMPEESAVSASADPAALDEVVEDLLRENFSDREAAEFARRGIAESMRGRLLPAEAELLAPIDAEKKLVYVGRKAIERYGCFGCHDVPGFESAKPIGIPLANWGRKDVGQLAFNHVVEFLENDKSLENDGAADAALDPFYLQGLKARHRSGFAWQKLRQPRSFDYQQPAHRPMRDGLRMPQFHFSESDREAIITVLLGLTAKPPAEKFVYRASPRRKALTQGEELIERFNCASCHLLKPERWQLALAPGQLAPPPPVKAFPLLRPDFTPEQLEQSRRPDPRTGRLYVTVAGMPQLSDHDAAPLVLDEYEDPIEPDEEYDPATLIEMFQLWDSVVVDGHVFEPGVVPLMLPATVIVDKRPAVGGEFARLILSAALQHVRAENPTGKGNETWAWLPPPLFGQGRKTRPEWLHAYLLDPVPIRPATVLRMPRFDLSREDADRLAAYFAAVDGVEFPYSSNSVGERERLARADAEYRSELARLDPPGEGSRFDDAMRLLLDETYCRKCHVIGDFRPPGTDFVKAPDLAAVHRRLQPEYVRRWLADPKRILPYATMPVNIPYDAGAPNQGGVSQDLYHGTSIEQLDAIVDLLANFDRFLAGRTKIVPMLQLPPPATADSESSQANDEAADNNERADSGT